MGRIRRIVSVLLTIVMAAGVLPVLRPGALAADVAFSGYCGAEGEDGANISWSLSTDGVLTLTGEGEMKVGIYVGYQRAWQDWQVNARTNVKKVVIGEGVTNINSGAFEDLEALTEVSIPGTVKRIEEHAFEGCVSLPEINIPEGVERISSYAFSGCGALKQFHIPASVSSLGNPIAGCDGVETITVAENNPMFRSAGNCVIRYGSENEYSNGELVCGCKTSVIPDDGSVTALGDYAFAGFSQLTEMKLPDSITRLGSSVFEDSGLRTFHVPAKLGGVGGMIFEGCGQLATITCDPANETYFAVGNCLIYKGSLRLVLGGVNSVIPDDGRVTSISRYAFFGRKGLTAIDIPEDVTEIGNYAFSGTGLIDVTIPGSVTNIGESVFINCSDLAEVTFSDGITYLPEYSIYNAEIVTIPKSVTRIHNGAFGDGFDIKHIYYTGTEEQWNAIKWYGEHYFHGDGYRDFEVPDGCELHFESAAPYHRVEEHTWDFGTVTTAPTASESGLMTYACTDPKCGVTRTEVIPATYGHTGAVELMASGTVPAVQYKRGTWEKISEEPLKWTLTSAGVLELSGEGAMSQDYYDGAPWGEYADFIVSVVIKYGVISISSGAFAGLENLKEAVIAETTVRIDGNAFHSCVNMVKVTIPEGVVNIMDNVFAGCYSLRELHLPASLERLGWGPFYGCSQLKTITVAPGNENFFVSGNCLVAINREYSSETGEDSVTGGIILRAGADNVIPADPAVTAIAYPAFTGCKDKKGGVTNLSIPANIVSLDTQAFTECPNISTITVDAANPVFRSAGNCVIDRATNAIVFGCQNSKIPTDGSVTAIADGAFYYCTNLTSLTIPDNITRIGYHAFTRTGLKDLYFYGSEARWKEIIRNPEDPDNVYLSNPGLPSGCVIHFGMSIPGCSTGNHTWDKGAVTKEATCGDKGQKTYKCEVCGSAKTEDIPATGSHTWDGGTVTKEATCANKGQKVYRCTVCDATRPEEIPATGNHTWDAGKVTKQPTATEKGERTYTCTVCKNTKKEDIPATGTPAHEHIWDDGTVTKEPTCGAKGEKTYTCTVCQIKRTEEIPATGNHTWDEGKVTKEPTATEKGERTYTCAVCKTTKKEDIPATGTPAHEHIWDEGKVTKEATCGAKGERTYACTVCGEPRTEEIPATGNHVWDEGKVTKEPTATEKGEKTYTCTVCKTTKSEDIPAAGEPAKIIASGDISLLEGELGDHVTWTLDSNGVLTISGEGRMSNIYGAWSSYEKDVVKAVVESGVTSIGYGNFADLALLESVEIPVSVTEIGNFAFDNCPPMTIRYAGTEEQWNAINKYDRSLPETYTIIYEYSGAEEPQEQQPGDLPEGVKQTEDGVRALPGQKKEDVLTGGLAGAVIKKRDGSELAGGELLGSGMKIVMPDGTEQTVVVKGDNDGDGVIASADARLALRASVGLERFENWQTDASLVTDAEALSPADARMILRASVGLEQAAAWF